MLDFGAFSTGAGGGGGGGKPIIDDILFGNENEWATVSFLFVTVIH